GSLACEGKCETQGLDQEISKYTKHDLRDELSRVYDVETFITHMFLTSGGPVKHIPAIDAELSFAQEHAEEGSEFDKFRCLD
ncbi:hypothetical protein Tco_1388708, partial [Tanacetum coccineum]